MHEISFSYPVDQDKTFGNAKVPVPAGLHLEAPEKVLGFDGATFMLVQIATPIAIQLLATYLYDRFFKPREPTKAMPKAVSGERVFLIGSPDDVIKMIEQLKKP